MLSLSASGTEGRARRKPTIIINASIPLPKYPHAIAIGTYRPASLTSSDMCAVASEPISSICVSLVPRNSDSHIHTEGAIYSCNLANHQADPHSRPITTIVERGEDGSGGVVRSHGEQDNHNDDPA